MYLLTKANYRELLSFPPDKNVPISVKCAHHENFIYHTIFILAESGSCAPTSVSGCANLLYLHESFDSGFLPSGMIRNLTFRHIAFAIEVLFKTLQTNFPSNAFQLLTVK